MSWFSNIFKKRKNDMIKHQEIPKQVMPQVNPNKQHKFDIIVFDIDEENGSSQQMRTEQNGIYANSADELRMLYARCGQKIKIVREYEETPDGNSKLVSEQQPMQPGNGMLTVEQANKMGIKLLPVEMPQKLQASKPVPQVQTNQPIPVEEEKPRYFSIGGIECKAVGSKIYQKQWVRADPKNYRLISDTNNKELPLTGKHIETLKWVMVEDEADQENDATGEENE